jgi:hypothetical protein
MGAGRKPGTVNKIQVSFGSEGENRRVIVHDSDRAKFDR